jgi:hypothetical protein
LRVGRPEAPVQQRSRTGRSPLPVEDAGTGGRHPAWMSFTPGGSTASTGCGCALQPPRAGEALSGRSPAQRRCGAGSRQPPDPRATATGRAGGVEDGDRGEVAPDRTSPGVLDRRVGSRRRPSTRQREATGRTGRCRARPWLSRVGGGRHWPPGPLAHHHRDVRSRRASDVRTGPAAGASTPRQHLNTARPLPRPPPRTSRLRRRHRRCARHRIGRQGPVQPARRVGHGRPAARGAEHPCPMGSPPGTISVPPAPRGPEVENGKPARNSWPNVRLTRSTLPFT